MAGGRSGLPARLASAGGGMEMKGTLLETGAGGPGGGAAPAQYAPGIVSTLFQPLVLGDVLPNVQATGSQVRYCRGHRHVGCRGCG